MRYKFRAWDKERKEMRDVQLMDWSDWWVSTGHTWERDKPAEYGERNSFGNEETDRHILMQWTGLTDRNGKDVYEGDILKIADDADEFITNGTVEWLHDFWNVSEIEDSLYGLTRNGYVEVIGNKFTHTELINS